MSAHLTSRQRNLDVLVSLCKQRLQSSIKTKSTDAYGNTILVDVDIFSQETLETFINFTISGFNHTPPFTNFSLEDDDFVNTFAELIVEGAILYALSSQALLEGGKEFSISDGGISLTLPSISEMLNTQFAILIKYHHANLTTIKQHFKITNDTGKVKGKHRYITTKDHGNFPKGTECWAERIDKETVIFEFDDGTKMRLGGSWFLLGSEMPRRSDIGDIRLDEEIIKSSSGLPSFLMVAAALVGGLIAASTKEEPIRVKETAEGEVDDRENDNQETTTVV